jgi:glyoxylase-like metal-dependent hydrolase (beta-lactamase superfamily II)
MLVKQNIILPMALVGILSAQSPAVQKAMASRLPADPNRVYSTFNTVLIDKELAPGVFAVFADDAFERGEKGLQVSTSSGYVIGEKGVLVIDAQQTKRLATNLIELIKEKTDKPILYVVNTNYYGDHSFGNQFFVAEGFRIINNGTKIIQHENAQKMIQNHFEEDRVFEYTLSARKEDVAEMQPTPADILITGQAVSKTVIDLGDKQVEIIYPGRTQTDGNLFVYLPKEKVLFGGNSIPSGGKVVGMPWLTYGGLDEFLKSLQVLRKMLASDTQIGSGHGYPTDIKALDNIIVYFQDLQKSVRQAVNKGLDLAQTKIKVKQDLEKYRNHTLFEMIQDLNIEKTYQEYKIATLKTK